MSKANVAAVILGSALAAGSIGLLVSGAVLAARGAPDQPGVAVTGSPPAETAAPSVVAPEPVEVEPLAEPGGISGLADTEWLDNVAVETGVPRRALAAYAGATLRANETWPTCNLGWNTLAGIGAVESHHGTINGSALDESGKVSPPIIGVELSGGGVGRVPDTDGGRLDSDPTWDRAVGPIQILPSTWETVAVDGNDDGVADPQQIDDAALAAANLLCMNGGNLADSATWIEAIWLYNPSGDYNRLVAEAASRYSSR